tara:strand:+ start:3407 stop:4570 length:1164 start_codon:yes stop_codon:yes gene_type:complete
MPYILPDVVKLEDKLESFLADISILTEKVYNISIYLGYKRCMARLWEKEDICKPDINKRCLNKTLVDYDLCRLHTAKEGSVKWCGRVTEYPDNIKIIACYRKRLKKHNIMISDKEILNKITLNHQLDYNERKLCVVSNADCINKPLLNLKKDIILKIKIVYNSRMHTTVSDKLSYQNDFADTLHLYNITKDEYNDKLRQYINNLDYDSIQNDLFDKSGSTSLAKKFLNVVDIMQPTRRECNYVAIEIAAAIRQNKLTESLRKTTSELNQSIIKKDIYSLDSIRFIDNNHNGYELYYNYDRGINTIYNSNSNEIGYLRNWIDEDGEVPSEYKTSDNTVLNPFNNLPVLELEISKKGSGFEPISPGIYREYEYLEDMESFRSTGQIIRN